MDNKIKFKLYKVFLNKPGEMLSGSGRWSVLK